MSLADKLSFSKKPIGVAPVRPVTFAPGLPGSKPDGRVGVIKKMVAVFKSKSMSTDAAAKPMDSAKTQQTQFSLARQDQKKLGLIKKAIGVFKRAPKVEQSTSVGIDLGDLAVALAKHFDVSELQAELARSSLQFEIQDQLWEFEKVGFENADQVILKTGIFLRFKNLEKVQIVSILCMAETLVKKFDGAVCVNNVSGHLEMCWRLGKIDKLSEKSSIKKFETAYAFVTAAKSQFLEEFGESAFRKPD